MIWVDLVGWTCAVLGSIAMIPQTVKLLRDRNTAGISLAFWQILMGISIGWASHGILTGSPHVIIPNAVTLACALITLYLIRQGRALGHLAVFGPGLALGTAAAMTDWFVGATAFGLLVAVPGILGILGQFIEIVRAPDVSGLSQGFLIMGVVTQVAWLTWGIATDDIAFLINAGAATTLTSLSYGWYLLRRRGLGPYLTAGLLSPQPVPVAEAAEGTRTYSDHYLPPGR